MLCGQSPRGYAHAVVSEGGRIVWDPHPTRAGLTLVKAAYLIHEWDTSAPTPNPIDHLMQAEHHHRETAAAEAVVGRVEALGWSVCVTESEHDPGCPGDERYCTLHCPVQVQRWLTDAEVADALRAALRAGEAGDE